MDNRIRYTVDEYTRNTYLQMPWFLFDAEFIKMSNDAKVLYTLLRNRHDMSVANGWKNIRGEIYLIMTREQMGLLLNMSENTVTKIVTELKKYALFDEERPGQGKPNKLYLLQVKKSEYQNRNNYDSRTAEIEVQDPQILRSSNIYSNKNQNSNISLSFNPVDIHAKGNDSDKGSFDTEDFYNAAVANAQKKLKG